MTKLSQTTLEKLKYYVYLLVDPRTSCIFYVGKGKNKRIFNHLECAISTQIITDKLDLIREIRDAGKEVKHYIVRHGMEEKEAFIVESVLIDLLMHQDLKSMDKITNLVRGHDQLDYGIKTIEEIENHYEPKLLNEQELKHTLLSININNTFSKNNISLYDATRAYWVLDPKRANQADFVVSEYRGVIRAIFKVDEKGWQSANNVDVLKRGLNETNIGKNRYYFSGEQVTDKEIENLYMNRKVSKKHGEANPIKYLVAKK